MGTCKLKGGQRTPAWIRVYKENQDGSKGDFIDEIYIERDQTYPISIENGRFRYEYKFSIGDPWSQDVGISCIGGEVPVP